MYPEPLTSASSLKWHIHFKVFVHWQTSHWWDMTIGWWAQFERFEKATTVQWKGVIQTHGTLLNKNHTSMSLQTVQKQLILYVQASNSVEYKSTHLKIKTFCYTQNSNVNTFPFKVSSAQHSICLTSSDWPFSWLYSESHRRSRDPMRCFRWTAFSGCALSADRLRPIQGAHCESGYSAEVHFASKKKKKNRPHSKTRGTREFVFNGPLVFVSVLEAQLNSCKVVMQRVLLFILKGAHVISASRREKRYGTQLPLYQMKTVTKRDKLKY